MDTADLILRSAREARELVVICTSLEAEISMLTQSQCEFDSSTVMVLQKIDILKQTLEDLSNFQGQLALLPSKKKTKEYLDKDDLKALHDCVSQKCLADRLVYDELPEPEDTASMDHGTDWL